MHSQMLVFLPLATWLCLKVPLGPENSQADCILEKSPIWAQAGFGRQRQESTVVRHYAVSTGSHEIPVKAFSIHQFWGSYMWFFCKCILSNSHVLAPSIAPYYLQEMEPKPLLCSTPLWIYLSYFSPVIFENSVHTIHSHHSESTIHSFASESLTNAAWNVLFSFSVWRTPHPAL